MGGFGRLKIEDWRLKIEWLAVQRARRQLSQCRGAWHPPGKRYPCRFRSQQVATLPLGEPVFRRRSRWSATLPLGEPVFRRRELPPLRRPWPLLGRHVLRWWGVRASSSASPLPVHPQERMLQDLLRTRHYLLYSFCLFHSAGKPCNATLHFCLQLFYSRIVLDCPVGASGLFGHGHLRRKTRLRLLPRVATRTHHAVDLPIFRRGDAEYCIIIWFEMRFEKKGNNGKFKVES